MMRNLVTRDREDQRVSIAFTRNGDFNNRALGALQQVSDVAGAQAIRGLVIYLDDDIARPDSCVISWSTHKRSHHHGVILAWRDDHAHTVVLAALVLAEQGELPRIKKVGVRVEHSEHTWNSALKNGFVHV